MEDFEPKDGEGFNRFDEDLLPYLVRYPLISNQAGQEPDGNPVLYSGFYAAIRSLYFPKDDQIKDFIRDVYNDCILETGLISRGSHKRRDEQEHDDYIGLATAAFLSGNPDIAYDIYDYGYRNHWVYDSQNTAQSWLEKLRFWHARFPGLVAHYKICAGVKLNPFDKLLFIISFLRPSKSESGIQLGWLRAIAYINSRDQGYLRSLIVKRWTQAVLKVYPMGMGEVFYRYFDRGTGPIKHVFAKWMQGRI